VGRLLHAGKAIEVCFGQAIHIGEMKMTQLDVE
jgi:hypothetical protein